MPTELEIAKSAAPATPEPAPKSEEAPGLSHYRRTHRRWRDNARKLIELVRDIHPPPEQQALRLRSVEQNIILPVKTLLVLIVSWYVFAPVASLDTTQGRNRTRPALTKPVLTNGVPDTLATNAPVPAKPPSLRVEVDPGAASGDSFNEGYRALRWLLVVYILINVPAAFLLLRPKTLGLRLRHIQGVILVISSLDAIFVASLTYLTEGFASIVFWLFPGLILRNSMSLPLARPQLLLNLLTILLYVTAGTLDLSNNYAVLPDERIPERSVVYHSSSSGPAEPFLLRIALLMLLTVCCYGLQVLLEKQRQTEEDARELTTRQQQLDVAARLAAQIAHQIKNPLGIINTTVYNLERSLRIGKREAAEHQLEMIREEINRADQVITRLMGYAQLKEGRVEKLDVVEEIERVLHEVFPPVAKYSTQIVKQFGPDLPSLWMQRQHLGDIFSNILLNAREALFGQGEIQISAEVQRNGDSLCVTIADNGPGIPAERANQVFQPYFTTKDKGSGLGLAIVKQNMSLYGGTVRVESEPGHGSRFILIFPTRALTKVPQ
ncbi:MAG: GHKL domain-containing protein [Verrucomicrobiales bacterium]|nr:GHKL domain-containing protein [Verrucomicrobiales bacterium]